MSPIFKRRISRCRRGLTLIELLITVVLVPVLIVAIWSVYHTAFKTFYSENVRGGVKGEAGRGFVRMTEELRHAVSVTDAQSTGVTFTADTDDNGADETIQYSWSGTAGDALNRIETSTLALINSVNSVAFSYYDSSHNLLSAPVTASQVRVVAVTLTVSYQDESFTLRSQVRLRNL